MTPPTVPEAGPQPVEGSRHAGGVIVPVTQIPARRRLERFRQQVAAELDFLDGALDADHPEGHECDVCRAADNLRALVEEQSDD